MEPQDPPPAAATDVPSSAEIEQLLPLVYQELRGIARRERRRISMGDTLATTALINETYLRLGQSSAFASRGDFLRIAAVAMRRTLIDHVRAQMTAKRGNGIDDATLDESVDFVVEDEATVLRVHDALETLAGLNPQLVAIVECRFFAGYSEAETAEALKISERSVQRHWATARAWLKKELAS